MYNFFCHVELWLKTNFRAKKTVCRSKNGNKVRKSANLPKLHYSACRWQSSRYLSIIRQSSRVPCLWQFFFSFYPYRIDQKYFSNSRPCIFSFTQSYKSLPNSSSHWRRYQSFKHNTKELYSLLYSIDQINKIYTIYTIRLIAYDLSYIIQLISPFKHKNRPIC